MPVSETKVNTRTLLLVAASFAIVVVMGVVLFVIALPSLNESGSVSTPTRALTFAAGPAKERAAAVAADGPFLFSDVGGGDRDIYLQHVGTDPLQGWTAFDARFPGSPRECTLVWNRETEVFREPDSCPNPRTVPADGTGLAIYPVNVTADEQVVIDLDLDKRRSGTTLGTTPATAAP